MSVSIVFARAMALELDRRGLDSAALLHECAIDPARLSNIRERLPFEEASRLTRRAVELTGDPGLGLSIAANTPLKVLQLIAHLLLSQRSIRAAFGAFHSYSALISEGPRFGLLERGDVATFTLRPGVPGDDVVRVMVDYGITIASRVGRQLRPASDADAESQLIAVWFQHAEPAYATRYREVFSCPVLFEQEVNGLVFPRALLDREQSHADETVSSLLQESAERLLRESSVEQTWGERLRLALRYHPNLAEATAESVARQLKTTERGLRRRLLAEGLTFSGLLDEARSRIACELLRRSDATIQDAADRLGFSEPSAFFRAFKRWTGLTPSEFRRLDREDAPEARLSER